MEWVLIDGAGGKHLLDSGDAVLIVLNQSDYLDVLRRRFFGRAKPYFEMLDGSYALRPPPIGVWERWNDWSSVASVVARFIEPPTPESLDPSQSIEIIRFILGRIREEVPRGARVILAHQGTRDFLGPKLGLSSTIFCQFADICIDLDDVLAADPGTASTHHGEPDPRRQTTPAAKAMARMIQTPM